ncbi:hypothetical protein BKA93DRAFT_344815 [Sparassis latifolia]
MDDITAGGINRHINHAHICGRQEQVECRWPTEHGLCKRRMQQGSLGRHVAASHLRSIAAVCDACNRKFSRKDALKRHQLKKHGLDRV